MSGAIDLSASSVPAASLGLVCVTASGTSSEHQKLRKSESGDFHFLDHANRERIE